MAPRQTAAATPMPPTLLPAAESPSTSKHVLDSMTYGDGDNGVHASQTRAIAAMVARGFADEDIDRLVLEATQRAHAKSGAGAWNWRREARAIRKSRESFQKKLANEVAADPAEDPGRPVGQGSATGSRRRRGQPFQRRRHGAGRWPTRHGGELRFVAPWGRWMLWNGSIWKADETLAVFTRAQTICRETAKRAKPRVAVTLSSARTAAAVVTMAKPRLAMVPAQFDANQWELVASTQTVDLRTGACRPPRPEDYATKRAASACAAPGTPCPLWTSFLLRVTNNNPELVDFLQRFTGYCLTGVTSEQVLAFLYGSGANGKTVFTSTVTGILGDYAVTAPMEMLLTAQGERHETEIAKLAGARLVTAHEVTGGRRWDEARIKQLTGSDRLTARFMRQDYFDFDPTHKLLVVGNHKPTLRNLDEAVRRRFLLVPFTVQIPAGERDPQLTDKLRPSGRKSCAGWWTAAWRGNASASPSRTSCATPATPISRTRTPRPVDRGGARPHRPAGLDANHRPLHDVEGMVRAPQPEAGQHEVFRGRAGRPRAYPEAGDRHTTCGLCRNYVPRRPSDGNMIGRK